MGMPSAVWLLASSLGQKRVNSKIRNKYNRASKAHANDSSKQIVWATVDLVDLEKSLRSAHTTLRCTICGVGAYSIGTHKVNCIWY